MKQAFVSASFSNKKNFIAELDTIKKACEENSIQSFIFINEYACFANHKLMMEQAMKDIDSSDILIAELSDKAIGVGIEIGYAKARQKTIIYLKKEKSEYSTTAAGLADYSISYKSSQDLKDQLNHVLKNI
jgi:nucleoside 2-deoxyribosyltransferase